MTTEEYWANRQEAALNKISNKTEKEINAQLNKYYVSLIKQVMADFEATYNKLTADKVGGTPTVADLYKLDRYWQMLAHLKQLCEQLGNKEIELFTKQFKNQWEETYKMAALPSDEAFIIPSESNAKQMINSVWCADGKTWSQRVWGNVQALQETLNDQLIHIVTTGKTTRDLRIALQDRFNVSRKQANMLIRTEINHIQTASAAKRYEDSGLKQYMILGREEGSCTRGRKGSIDCHDMDGKVFDYTDMKVGTNAPPFHPNCRCRINPVMDDEFLRKRQEENRKKEQEKRAKKREAMELKAQAEQLRAKARALKKEGKIEEAKQLEAQARALEKRYRQLFAELNNNG